MNKTAIRNFAVWARNKLIADVSYHAGLMGITKNGIAHALPQSTKDVEFFDIGTAEPYAVRGEAIQQRKSLVEAIRQKEKDSNYETAYSSLMEEVAYTWFNRLIAVRFMEVNDYLPAHVRVLSSESGKQEPDIVTNPFDAELFFAEGEDQKIIQMKNDNKLDEVFRILFVKQCRELFRILPRLFEGTNDYTELLLSVSFIDQEGVVYHLVNDIPEDDFNVDNGGQVEIIGWLYQYYIAEHKDYLINAHKKYKKQDIPFVTQLFTSEWIVKYMVENSLGRLWIDGHPNDSIYRGWDFYLQNDSESLKEEIDIIRTRKTNIHPEDIKFIDPCVGSGHILVYAFDVFMDLYRNAGWTDREAAKSIVENNLFGIDIDERAGQIAYFSVMMKARQYNRGIFSSEKACKVFSLIEGDEEIEQIKSLFTATAQETICALLTDFKDIKEIGSLVKLSVTYDECKELLEAIKAIDDDRFAYDVHGYIKKIIVFQKLKPLVEQALILLGKYQVVVTNPPYMNSSQMPDNVKKYLAKEYAGFSNDLFSAFVLKAMQLCEKNGYVGLLMPYVWMFISSYEEMRIWINENTTITSLIQLEYNAFEAACVPVAALTLCNNKSDILGEYIKLSDFKGVENQEPKTKEAVKNPKCGYRYSTNQKKYKSIPGQPIAFWMSKAVEDAFIRGRRLGEVASIKQGLKTGDNEKFLRMWFEISGTKFSRFNGLKWYPCNKGGDYRRWYGNNDYVINWENEGYELKNFKDADGRLKSRPQNLQYQFKEGLTYTNISSSKFGIRYCPDGFAFDAAGSMIFPEKEKIYYLLGLLSSNAVLAFTRILSPTMSFEVGQISSIPYLESDDKKIRAYVIENIQLAKEEYDSFESSWDFKKHPLV